MVLFHQHRLKSPVHDWLPEMPPLAVPCGSRARALHSVDWGPNPGALLASCVLRCLTWLLWAETLISECEDSLCSVTSVVSNSLCPQDCSTPGPSAHGILQTRILEVLPCPPPGGLPDPGSDPDLLGLLHWQVDSLPLASPGKPICTLPCVKWLASGKLLYNTGSPAWCSVMT